MTSADLWAYEIVQALKGICRSSATKAEARAVIEAKYGKIEFLEHFRPFMDLAA